MNEEEFYDPYRYWHPSEEEPDNGPSDQDIEKWLDDNSRAKDFSS